MTTYLNNPKPGSAQESIRISILKFYRINGIDLTKVFCQKLLEAQEHKSDKDFKSKVHGEICEALLEAMLLDYIAENKLQNKWFIEKGMVVKDIDSNNSSFLTELDLTLFTPGRVILFECKSYAGEKRLVGECTISRKGGKFDVYKQHRNHMKVLDTNIRSCYNGKPGRAYKMVLFNFSIGTLKDAREEKWRKIMPVLGTESLNQFLDMVKQQPEVWDIRKLKKICDIIMQKNDALRKKHLKYVTSLNH